MVTLTPKTDEVTGHCICKACYEIDVVPRSLAAQLEQECVALQEEIATYKELLLDPYVFFAMQHKACRPWRKTHDAWLDRVEALTGWEPFDQIEQYRANESTQTK